MNIEFRILGPLEVIGNAHSIAVSSAKQRLLLGLLLARANHPVTIDALIEGLWSAGPPATATGVLYSHVSQLRKHLESPVGPGPQPPRVLQRTATGYQLVVAPDRLDADCFESLTAAARGAADAGRFVDVAAQLATDTASAAAGITARIEAIQSDTDAAVRAIKQINSIVARINETQSMIVAAVEEQTATTAEIGRSVNEAALATESIGATLDEVNAAASRTSHGASDTREAATELTQVAVELRELVGQFRY